MLLKSKTMKRILKAEGNSALDAPHGVTSALLVFLWGLCTCFHFSESCESRESRVALLWTVVPQISHYFLFLFVQLSLFLLLIFVCLFETLVTGDNVTEALMFFG